MSFQTLSIRCIFEKSVLLWLNLIDFTHPEYWLPFQGPLNHAHGQVSLSVNVSWHNRSTKSQRKCQKDLLISSQRRYVLLSLGLASGILATGRTVVWFWSKQTCLLIYLQIKPGLSDLADSFLPLVSLLRKITQLKRFTCFFSYQWLLLSHGCNLLFSDNSIHFNASPRHVHIMKSYRLVLLQHLMHSRIVINRKK